MRSVPLLAALGVISTALLALLPRAVRAEQDVALAVIVAPTSKLTNISFDDLRRVFQSERVGGADGARLIALNQPPKTPDRVGFDHVVLGMDSDAVGRFWISRKIEHGNAPPRSVTSLTTLRRVVEKLPGAIAYIRPGQLGSQVRAIRIDGKLPEDPHYALRYKP
jgi:hypothetical protein